MIKVEYRFESDEMSDEEYNNQEEQEFIITEDMIDQLIMMYTDIPKGYDICRENLYVSLL